EKHLNYFAREGPQPYLCPPQKGSLAQLVQSICLTSRGSAVRSRQLPQSPPGSEDFSLMSYCTYILNVGKDSVHKSYHDKEYGFPLSDDDDLFARLVLEINQAGLSWETILKKK